MKTAGAFLVGVIQKDQMPATGLGVFGFDQFCRRAPDRYEDLIEKLL